MQGKLEVWTVIEDSIARWPWLLVYNRVFC